MPTYSFSRDDFARPGQIDTRVLHKFEAIAGAEQTDPVRIPSDAADILCAISGTFGSATVVLQGSIDGGTIWNTVKDIDGTDISKTAAAPAIVVRDAWPLMRWSTSGGTGSDIDALISVGRVA